MYITIEFIGKNTFESCMYVTKVLGISFLLWHCVGNAIVAKNRKDHSWRELESSGRARLRRVRADSGLHRRVTRGITCNLVTAGALVTLNRSLITVPARIGSLPTLSRATPCKLISAVLYRGALGLASRIRFPLSGIGNETKSSMSVQLQVQDFVRRWEHINENFITR